MNKCPKCSTEFSENTAGGLCPACLLQQGLDSQAAVTAPPQAATSFSDTWSQPAVDQPMSPERLMALLPQFDQFELIGRGGMGVVYKARQKNLDRPVALKVLSPEIAGAPGFAERFAREARAMARLSHPNIVAVHDFGCVDNAGAELCYFTMEFVDGSNLRALIKQLTPTQALAIVPQICEALQFAHDIGIVHRDIKPENILVDKKGRVKIADFGLAKLLEQARTTSDYTLTRMDMAMGTPAYMAPEQLERPMEVDHRADLYSLGVVFYEMLTGQLPKGRFQLPSQRVQIDVRFDEVVLKALEHDPELRYQHASEVQTSVEAVRGTPLQVARAPSQAAQPPVSTGIAAPAAPTAFSPDPSSTAQALEYASPLFPSPRLSRMATREPARFYAKAFGLYVLAWIAFLLLWNLGWPGFILSVILFATIARLQAKRLLAYRPEMVAARNAEPQWKRRLRPSNVNAAFSLGFLLILLGVALDKDASNQNVAGIFDLTPSMTDDSRDFLKNAQQDQPKALDVDVRDLTLNRSLRTAPGGFTVSYPPDPEPLPATIFQPIHPSAAQEMVIIAKFLLYPAAIPPEFRPIPHFWILELFGLYLFIAGFADMLSSKGYHFSGLAWKPAFALTAILLVSFFVSAFCGEVVFGMVRTSKLAHGEFVSRSTEFQILKDRGDSGDHLFPALDRWALDHGYIISALVKARLEDSHRLPATPTSTTYRAAILWKPGLFDRVGMSWQGVFSRSPEILVQSADSPSGSYTWLTLPVWPRTKAENDAANTLQKDLYLEIKRSFAEGRSSASQPTTRPFAAEQSPATQPAATPRGK